MGDLPATLLGRLDAEFRRHRDPPRAASMSAYMRGRFEFYGIPAPAQRAIARQALRELDGPTEAELKQVVLDCWARPEREWQYFACGYLRSNVRTASAGFLSTAKKLITRKPWWDTVDSLAIRTVGPLVARHPRLVRTMDHWIDSSDIWLARTAILHQLTYKAATDPGRLFAYCLRRTGDDDFFIRKAIGWALREYSKTDPVAVRAFVRDHQEELAPLSGREALKWLDRAAK